MTRQEFREMAKGTKLLVGNTFLDGEDTEIEMFLGKVITFDYFKNDKWVYFKEHEDAPFRYDEINCVYKEAFIDDVEKYEIGDMDIIFGGMGV